MYVRSTSVCLFKHKTAYEMRISDWSSDVCSSDLLSRLRQGQCLSQDAGCLLGLPVVDRDAQKWDRIALETLCSRGNGSPRRLIQTFSQEIPDRKSVV